jgi:hypothetical protein
VSQVHPGLMTALPDGMALRPASLLGFIPFAALIRFHGFDRLWAIEDPPAVFVADQSRALAFGFLSRDPRPPGDRGLSRSGGDRLLGFDPVNQPCFVDDRPCYSTGIRTGQPMRRGLCCHGFWFPLSGRRTQFPNPRARCCLRVNERADECETRARGSLAIAPRPPLLAPIRSCAWRSAGSAGHWEVA